MMFIHDRQHFFLVLSLNRLPLLFKICETVVTETPAISAISLMVSFTLVAPFYLNSLSVYQTPKKRIEKKESMFFDKNLLYLPTWRPSIQVLYLIYFIVKNNDSVPTISFRRKNSSLFLKTSQQKRTDTYPYMHAQFHFFAALLFFS